MRVAIGCDHIVTDLKNKVVKWLESEGIEVIDCGTNDHIRTHYPLYGHAVGVLVATHKADFGVCICGTGVGISNAVNKVKNIRCVLTQRPVIAKLARQLYDMNVVAMGGDVINFGLVKRIISTFLFTPYLKQHDDVIAAVNKLIPHENYDPAIFVKEVDEWNSGCYTDNHKPEQISIQKLFDIEKK